MANFVRFTTTTGMKVTVNAEYVSHIEHTANAGIVVMIGGSEYHIPADKIEALETFLNDGGVPDIDD